MKRLSIVTILILLIVGLLVSCNSDVAENLFKDSKCKITFVFENAESKAANKLLDEHGKEVTTITVHSGAEISVGSNFIMIAGMKFTAEPGSGWEFSGFNPNTGTITSATNINVLFAQLPPP